MSILTAPIPSYRIPAKKYCPGCKKFLDIELFGLNRRRGNKISDRCKSCNHESMLQRKRAIFFKFHPDENRYIFSPLKLHPPLGTYKKRCPSCKTVLYVCPKQNTGICGKCKSEFSLSPVLNQEFGGFKLNSVIGTRTDYTSIFIKFIYKHTFTYQAEIVRKLYVDRFKAMREIKKLEIKGLIKTQPALKYNIISLSEAGLKLAESYKVENVL